MVIAYDIYKIFLWETTYGLDQNTDDAGDDPDMDTFTNLQEYEGGSDPQSSSSTPATQ